MASTQAAEPLRLMIRARIAFFSNPLRSLCRRMISPACTPLQPEGISESRLSTSVRLAQCLVIIFEGPGVCAQTV